MLFSVLTLLGVGMCYKKGLFPIRSVGETPEGHFGVVTCERSGLRARTCVSS